MKFGKKTAIAFFLVGYILAVPLNQTFAQSQTSQAQAVTVEFLKQALEERHQAVEDAFAAAFSMMNDYHSSIMGNEESNEGDVFYYLNSENSGDFGVRVIYSDASDLTPAFTSLVENGPTASRPSFQYFSSESERSSYLGTYQPILDELQNNPPSDYPGEETQIDPVSQRRIYWEWWTAKRKELIEDGQATLADPDYATAEKDFQISSGTEAEYQEAQGQYNARLAAATTLVNEINGAQIMDPGDPQYQTYLDGLADYSAAVIQERDQVYGQDYSNRANRLETFLRSSEYQSAKRRQYYLLKLLSAELPQMPLSGFYPCGAVFQPAVLNWPDGSAGDLESDLAVLNKISRELDRLEPFYLRVSKGEKGDNETLESGDYENVFNAMELDGRLSARGSIGMVNHENYRAQILRIAARLNEMKTLRWPMLVRRTGVLMDSQEVPGGLLSLDPKDLNFGLDSPFAAPAIQYSAFGSLSPWASPASENEDNPSAVVNGVFAFFGTANSETEAEFRFGLQFGGRKLDPKNEVFWGRFPSQTLADNATSVGEMEFEFSVMEDPDHIPWTPDPAEPSDSEYWRDGHGGLVITSVPKSSNAPDFPDTVPPRDLSVRVTNTGEILYGTTQWLPGDVQAADTSGGMGAQVYASRQFEFPTIFDLSGYAGSVFTPAMVVDSTGGACRILFPLDSSSGIDGVDPVLSLNLTHGHGGGENSDNPDYFQYPIWALTSLEGDISNLTITSGAPKGNIKVIEEDDGEGFEPITDSWQIYPEEVNLPIVKIASKKVTLQLDWLGPYSLKAIYKDGNDTVAEYAVKVPNDNGTFYRSDEDYPSSHAVLELWKDQTQTGTIRFTDSHSPLSAEDGELWSYEDLSDGSKLLVKEVDYTNKIGTESITAVRTNPFDFGNEVGAFDKVTAKGYGSTVFGSKSVVSVLSAEDALEDSVDEELSVSFGEWPPDHGVISYDDSADPLLPWAAIPSKLTYSLTANSTATWSRAGDVEEFAWDGSLEKITSTTAGLASEQTFAFSGNTLDVTQKLGNQTFAAANTVFADGGSQITTTANDSTVTTEYFTNSTNSGIPWMPKKVTTARGVTEYSYSVPANGGDISATKTFTAPDGTTYENVETYTDLGALKESIQKVNGTNVGSATATGHNSGYLGRATDLTTNTGGISWDSSVAFDTRGKVKSSSGPFGVNNQFRYDEFDRLSTGTKLDGVPVSPTYSGLTFSANVGGKSFSQEHTIDGDLVSSISDIGLGHELTNVGGTNTDFSSSIPDEGNRSSTRSFFPDGALQKTTGGAGRSGSSLEYTVEQADGQWCLATKSTVLHPDGTASNLWEKHFVNGYGQLLRIDRPHPDSSVGGTVTTKYTHTYTHSPDSKTVTVNPPIPSLPITVSYEDNWTKTKIKRGTVEFESTRTVAGTEVTTTNRLNGEIVSQTVRDLATNSVETIPYSRTEGVTSFLNQVGDEIKSVVTGPFQSRFERFLGKDGVRRVSTTSGGNEATITINGRHQLGEPESVTVSPGGALGDQTIRLDEDGHNITAEGPGVSTVMNREFAGGEETLSVDNSATGDSYLQATDADGHLMALNRPDKQSLEMTGNSLDGQISVNVVGLPNQVVTYKYGPTQVLLEKIRNDGSGVRYTPKPDGSYATMSRYDNFGTHNFTFTYDLPGTGFFSGYTIDTSPGSYLATTFNANGTPDDVTYASECLAGMYSHETHFDEYTENRVSKESYAGTLLSGYSVERQINPDTGVLDGVSLLQGGNVIHQINWTRDAHGRLGGISVPGELTANYGYTDTRTSLTTNFATYSREKVSDGTGRLLGVQTTSSSRNYRATLGYAGQHLTGQTIQGWKTLPRERWRYDYDGQGQLDKATPTRGDALVYNHDEMGNRAALVADSSNFYTAYYSPFAQTYTVEGTVDPGSEVYIRHGEAADGIDLGGVAVPVNPDGSFRRKFAAPSSTQPQNIDIKVVAILRGAGTNGTDAVSRLDRTESIPATQGNITYGAHGAQSGDPNFLYHWNPEGRLMGVESQGGDLLRSSYAYDHEGRRIWKKTEYLQVDPQSGETSVYRNVETKFLYDGGLLLAEIIDDDASPGQKSRYYIWGNDVSGSLQGAGGVGGLIGIIEDGIVYSPAYDAAGNVIALMDESGNEVAYWRRGPFGEVLESGGQVDKCPFGFATHYTDEETDLVYFGYRYYSPQTGRWLSREPLGEFESFNLYAYCHNDPINKVDYLGLDEIELRVRMGRHGLIEQVWYIDEFLNGPNYNDGEFLGILRADGWVDLGNGRFTTMSQIKREAGFRWRGSNFDRLREDMNRTIPRHWAVSGVPEGEGDGWGPWGVRGRAPGEAGEPLLPSDWEDVQLLQGAVEDFAKMGVSQYGPLAVAPQITNARSAMTAIQLARVANRSRAIALVENVRYTDDAKRYVDRMADAMAGAGTSTPAMMSRVDELLMHGIPGNTYGAFNRWFDNLSADDFLLLWNSSKNTRETIKGRIRHPGGLHEWLMAARAPTFKQWGITMDQIKDLRSLNETLLFTEKTLGGGIHGHRLSGRFHFELRHLIDASRSYDDFITRLQRFGDRWLTGGSSSLPPGLQR